MLPAPTNGQLLLPRKSSVRQFAVHAGRSVDDVIVASTTDYITTARRTNYKTKSIHCESSRTEQGIMSKKFDPQAPSGRIAFDARGNAVWQWRTEGGDFKSDVDTRTARA